MTDSSISAVESPPDKEADPPNEGEPMPTEERERSTSHLKSKGEKDFQETKDRVKKGWGGTRKGAGRKRGTKVVEEGA